MAHPQRAVPIDLDDVCERLGLREDGLAVSDPAFDHDVQKRVPSVEKARAVLGFEATTSLDEMLDEVVPWVVDAVGRGLI